MAHAIANTYEVDKNVKMRRAENQKDSNYKPLGIGTKVLRYFRQPPGTCAKLYRNWKGMFLIVEILDKNTYVIAREDDGRRKFIVHRENLRPIGAVNECAAQLSDPEPSTDPNSGDGLVKNEEGLTPSVDGTLRRSHRLKNKSTDFKRYFYDDCE